MATRAVQLLAGLWRAQRSTKAEQRFASGDGTNHDPREWRSPVAGRVIDNLISGERIVIRESGAQTGGELLSFDLFLPPGGPGPARHAHPEQEERFTVVAGRIRFRLGRRTILAAPGDTVLIPLDCTDGFSEAYYGRPERASSAPCAPTSLPVPGTRGTATCASSRSSTARCG